MSRTRCSVQRCSAEPGPTSRHTGWTPDQQRITPKGGALRSIRGTQGRFYALCDFRLISSVMPLSRFRWATSMLKPPDQSAPEAEEFAPPEVRSSKYGKRPDSKEMSE